MFYDFVYCSLSHQIAYRELPHAVVSMMVSLTKDN